MVIHYGNKKKPHDIKLNYNKTDKNKTTNKATYLVLR